MRNQEREVRILGNKKVKEQGGSLRGIDVKKTLWVETEKHAERKTTRCRQKDLPRGTSGRIKGDAEKINLYEILQHVDDALKLRSRSMPPRLVSSPHYCPCCYTRQRMCFQAYTYRWTHNGLVYIIIAIDTLLPNGLG